MLVRDLPEIRRGGRGGEGVGILNLGSEMRLPTPVIGVKFSNHPLELGLKYHDPPHLTELKEKCSRLFKVLYSKPTSQKGNKNKIKGKQRKLATRMEANCKRVIETIAPQQESHDVTEPIGQLSLHYEGISGLLKTQRPHIQYALCSFSPGCSQQH